MSHLFGFGIVCVAIFIGAFFVAAPALGFASKKQKQFEPQPLQKAVQSVVSPVNLPTTAIPAAQKERVRTAVADLPADSATLCLQDKGDGTINATAVVWTTVDGVRREVRRVTVGQLSSIDGIDQPLIEAAMQRARSAIRGEEPASAELAGAASDAVMEEIKHLMPLVLAQQQHAEKEAEQGAVKLLAKPIVTKGELVRASKMAKEGAEPGKTVYGAIVRKDDGTETTLWGAGLKTEIAKAGAKVGDQLEIIKLGRKTIEEGKGPMNVYKVTKLLV